MIEKARLSHTEQIHELISSFAKRDLLLPRSKPDIYEHIREFFVFTEGEEVLGCCALHIVWKDLGEIRSLAVRDENQREGIGKALVQACIDEARDLGLREVFALTYVPEFFEKIGFRLVDKHTLPRKIWTDCVNCPYFPDCEEQAVVKSLRENKA